MKQSLESVVALSRQYCDLIEGCTVADQRWLASLARLFPRLKIAVEALDHCGDPVETSLVPDLDARFELFVELMGLLGENDAYWQPFDRTGDRQSMTGSLADDLTDIYCELKHALQWWEIQPEKTPSVLCFSYRRHWKQHLQDAKRHLDVLLQSRQMPSPPQRGRTGWRPVALVG
ncbi:DUF5063 domain-containing protein [Gammaproteobacteria bacterium]